MHDIRFVLILKGVVIFQIHGHYEVEYGPQLPKIVFYGRSRQRETVFCPYFFDGDGVFGFGIFYKLRLVGYGIIELDVFIKLPVSANKVRTKLSQRRRPLYCG